MKKDMEVRNNEGWVAERLAHVKPAWEPQAAKAWLLVEERSAPRPRLAGWRLAATGLAAMVVAVMAIPQGRAIAQEVWFRLFLDRVEVVRVDLSDLPFRTQLTGSGQRAAAGMEEAGALAGFRPQLPPAAAWPGTPALTVIGAMTFEQTVRTGEIKAALGRAGASDVAVPEAWDGMTIRASMGPMVSASYANEIQILQAKPAQLFLPAGLSLERFAETLLRSVGLSWWESRAVARRFAAQPSLMLGIPADEAAKIEEVRLRWGSGMLVEEFNEDRGGIERVTLLFGGKERVFAVMSPSREECLRVAEQMVVE
ncbi:MAG: hypothetical protein JST93_14100 [Acidobacteria bacterium]|nr:hypothetical protein [Acidobacteriota bacterium]